MGLDFVDEHHAVRRSAGVLATISNASPVKRSLSSGVLSSFAVSAWILPITSEGDPAGANKPTHVENSKPGSLPASASVGTSGRPAARLGEVTASARKVPAFD